MANLLGIDAVVVRPEARESASIASPAERMAPKGPTFGDFLQRTLSDANTLQVDAASESAGLANMDHNRIHEVMIALEKADISFRLLTAVRNKLVEAYREIMRMPV